MGTGGSSQPRTLFQGQGTAPARDLDPNWAGDENNQVRVLGFLIALVYVFFRTGMIHEVMAARVGNIYFFPLVGAPVILLAFASGSFRRIFAARPGKMWLLFGAWMAISALFSTWKSDSANLWFGYLQTSLAVLLVVGGLTLTVRDCRRMIGAMALGAAAISFSARFFFEVNRQGSDFGGSIGNTNDLAAHFLFLLPFVLCWGMAAKTKVVRLSAVILLTVLVAQIAGTGSRGALIAAAAMVAFGLWRGSNGLRLAFAVLTPLALFLAVTFLPSQVLDRYRTILDEDRPTTTSEATASTETRKYLFRTSLQVTMDNPFTGVGPSQFANIEGETSRENRRQGAWQVTHNAYTQVSSELGIPGFLIFAGALISTYLALARTIRLCQLYAAQLPQLQFLGTASFCTMFSLVGFGVAIIFLSQAYALYLPLLAGLTIALERAVQREVRLNGTSVPTLSSRTGVRGI